MKRYRIGEFAKIKNIDAQTLRYYDKIGLLKPDVVDEENGYRYYTSDQFIIVDTIKFNKLLGLSIEEMIKNQQIQSLDEKLDVITDQRNKLEAMIRQYQLIKEDLDSILENIDQAVETYQTYGIQPRIKDIGDIRCLVADCSGLEEWVDMELKIKELTQQDPNYFELGHNHGLVFGGRFPMITEQDDRYLDWIIKPTMGLSVENPDFESFHLGKCIVALHKGTHEGQKVTFQGMLDFAQEKDLKTKGLVFSRSIVGSFIVNNKEEFLQSLMIPIVE